MTSQRLRSAQELHALYASRRARCVSLADGPGFLYAFIEYGHCWKIGMTDNYDRRKAEWDCQCPCPDRVWLPPLHVPRRRRSESLAHILLELKCFKRPRIQCTHCITSKNSSSLEDGDEFGEERFGQCLCALDLCKVYTLHSIANRRAFQVRAKAIDPWFMRYLMCIALESPALLNNQEPLEISEDY
ncbi:hypothetical protein EV359DRAFT_60192 [Lentinula novae-zelandiae]|nr:hypothetical protein EV359DRAFT_60192 [Lentinula novae-zelandiae]